MEVSYLAPATLQPMNPDTANWNHAPMRPAMLIGVARLRHVVIKRANGGGTSKP